ncbi:MAG TPA: response regulator transcription factor [Desulfobacterales bacterium]|nr:response regulator transcription factor [Desulfobacterales bacterium]
MGNRKSQKDGAFMIKILIADDHAIVREGLKQIVADTTDLVVTGEAKNEQETLKLVRKGDFDVILLDIAMPGRGGLETLKQIKTEKPELPVLILSMYPEEQYAVRALKMGAAGYLTKVSAPDELIKAIKKISTGRKYISSSLAEKLAFNLEVDTGKPPHEGLSNREFQVMCMIASGKTVKQIAEELFLSVNTISTYRARVLEKMRMKTNSELTYYAIKNQIVL